MRLHQKPCQGRPGRLAAFAGHLGVFAGNRPLRKTTGRPCAFSAGTMGIRKFLLQPPFGRQIATRPAAFALSGGVPLVIGDDEGVEVAVEHGVDVSGFVVAAQVLHHLVGV